METHKIGNLVNLTTGHIGYIVGITFTIGNRVLYSVVAQCDAQDQSFSEIVVDHDNVTHVADGKTDVFGFLPPPDFLEIELGDEVIDKLTGRIGVVTSFEYNRYAARVVGVIFKKEHTIETTEVFLPVSQLSFYGIGISDEVTANIETAVNSGQRLHPGDRVKCLIGDIEGVVTKVSYLNGEALFNFLNPQGDIATLITYECLLEKLTVTVDDEA